MSTKPNLHATDVSANPGRRSLAGRIGVEIAEFRHSFSDCRRAETLTGLR